MAGFLFEASISALKILRPGVLTLLGFIVLLCTAFLGAGRLYEFLVKEEAIKG